MATWRSGPYSCFRFAWQDNDDQLSVAGASVQQIAMRLVGMLADESEWVPLVDDGVDANVRFRDLHDPLAISTIHQGGLAPAHR